jgi:hypothetical protein
MLETGIYPDFIVVDGKEGGTGAAPLEFLDHLGMPMREGLSFVHNALIGIRARDRIRLGVPVSPTKSAARKDTSPAPLPTSSTRMPETSPASPKNRRVIGSTMRACSFSRASSWSECPRT